MSELPKLEPNIILSDLDESFSKLLKKIDDLIAERGALKKALEEIGNADGCGCSPICECLSQPSLEIWKEGAMETAKAVLSKYPEARG